MDNTFLMTVVMIVGCLVAVVIQQLLKEKGILTAKNDLRILAAKKDLQENYPEEYALWVWQTIELGNNWLGLNRVTIDIGQTEAYRWHPTTIFHKFDDAMDFCKKHGIRWDKRNALYPHIELWQSDVDFFEAYKRQNPSLMEHEQHIIKTVHDIKDSRERSQAMSVLHSAGLMGSPADVNQKIQEQTFGKPKEKSAAGSMVKGAAVGGVVAGAPGAVVGAMVGKEVHEHKKNQEKK
jgi:hypothetical protein